MSTSSSSSNKLSNDLETIELLIDDNEKNKKASNILNHTWNCSDCTFLNSIVANSCEMCGHARINHPKSANSRARITEWAKLGNSGVKRPLFEETTSSKRRSP